MVKLRKFVPSDAPFLRDLFFYTVRHVNIRDYSPAQVQAWAPDEYDREEWLKKIALLDPFVVDINGVIVAYADIQPDGYIDHFFCHHQYQGQGLGRMLMQKLKSTAQQQRLANIYAHVSITAKPFFLKHGFSVTKAQQVEVRGQVLKNFVMTFEINPNE